MKLKIVERGWSGFTGDLGTVRFVDGVSADHVSQLESNRISAMIRVVEVDKSGNDLGLVGIANDMVRTRDLSIAPAPLSISSPPAPAIDAPAPVEVEAPAAPEKVAYTNAQLEEIADRDGIKGLRVISDPMGLKATSIPALIDQILQASRA